MAGTYQGEVTYIIFLLAAGSEPEPETTPHNLNVQVSSTVHNKETRRNNRPIVVHTTVADHVQHMLAWLLAAMEINHQIRQLRVESRSRLKSRSSWRRGYEPQVARYSRTAAR